MGEAKQRGTYEERKAQAIARLKAERDQVKTALAKIGMPDSADAVVKDRHSYRSHKTHMGMGLIAALAAGLGIGGKR